MEAIRQPFKTNLFQGDYVGNAIGMRAPEIEIMGSESINPENFRVRNYYPAERLQALQDAHGEKFGPLLEDNMEPALIEYCDDLVDRMTEIIQNKNLNDEAKAKAIQELHTEAKSKQNMDDIWHWKEMKEAERLWKEGPSVEIRKAA